MKKFLTVMLLAVATCAYSYTIEDIEGYIDAFSERKIDVVEYINLATDIINSSDNDRIKSAGYLMRADGYVYLKEYTKAENDLNNSLALRPENLITYMMLAELYAKQNQTEKVAKTYENMKKQFADVPEIIQFIDEQIAALNK